MKLYTSKTTLHHIETQMSMTLSFEYNEQTNIKFIILSYNGTIKFKKNKSKGASKALSDVFINIMNLYR